MQALLNRLKIICQNDNFEAKEKVARIKKECD